MPVQRFSQGFKDVSLSFKRHPVNNDILALKNEDAIKRSVQNLVRINFGEVMFDPLVGTKISVSHFELANDDYVVPLKTQIELTLRNYEPRVQLTDVTVQSEPDQNYLDVTIEYDIVGLDAPSQSINFILEPTRL